MSRGPKFVPVEDRFWTKVEKTEGCWNWTAAKYPTGYGQIRIDGSAHSAHRVAYELTKGPIPDGLFVDHICHNRACVNPKHLRLATAKQNQENRSSANKNSKSGVRGVSWFKPHGLWQAAVGHEGRTVHLGYFKTVAEAEAAVVAKRNELFTHHNADGRAA
jgi:hypothetical protein